MAMPPPRDTHGLTLSLSFRHRLSLEDLKAYAEGRITSVRFEDKESLTAAIERNHAFFRSKLEQGWPIYGAVTGFGSSSASRVLPREEDTHALQTNLFRYHGCGVGPSFDDEALSAILLVRLNCLLQGASGVSFSLLERLCFMVDHKILPIIPIRGSVGASGDLTPLSYVAAVMAGERKLRYQGQTLDAKDFWPSLNEKAYTFRAREALAIMNGTSVMTAVAGLAWKKLEALYESLCFATALLVEIWDGASSPFLPELHEVKPHKGQMEAAALITSYLKDPYDRLTKHKLGSSTAGSVQDPYSIRCAPQILGAFRDALSISRVWIETEMNSVNDNPVFRDEEELVLNGGHFLGQHITMAADLLRSSLANVINLADRQLALLMEAKGRLPENLVSPEVDSHRHHAFKAMQISMSAIAAELAKLSMPMAAFSRSTEASNQDVVSMGTTSARELYEVSDLAMEAMAIHLMALSQAAFVKDEPTHLTEVVSSKLAKLREVSPPLREDRALDLDIQKVKTFLYREAW